MLNKENKTFELKTDYGTYTCRFVVYKYAQSFIPDGGL